ncbi:AAA family ATPase [Kaustia mangrovi]|uniref:AAA family ATPase n=1 Tax=Kaustia mangrovi TaxID=2593653 RepID=A0A7S8C3C0_9HYPH|nr:bifunctional aminoglycoside phosphotransferase/ATP-binding protein [Kaustia mangrovi]QPC42609.1 AAA family ATPase [Kaustia mangrovi]
MVQDGQDRQDEVEAFLMTPSSYRPAPGKVDRIDTHGAMVFLAGKQAVKIKRAVALPYMDFSTLEKRRAVCEREFELNRPNAPRIYRDVVAITREADGALRIGGSGEPVEWAVRMTRFDQEQILDRICERGALDDDLLDRLARIVAKAHKRAPVDRSKPGHDRIAAIVDQIDRALAAAADVVPEDRRRRFAQMAGDALAAARHCLDLRAERGFVRRCHGDLHLANIVVMDGEPALFDALEFDDELATIDVLYDLAYLLMDLIERGRRAEAHRVLNRYLRYDDALANVYGLVALPLFLACRAGVRAIVSLDRAGQVEGEEKAALEKRALAYLDAALGYLAPSTPRLVAIGGLSGTGKTTLAAGLAPGIGRAPGALHLRSDVERKAMFNVDDTDALPEEAYTQETSDRVYDLLLQKARIALRAGHSVVVDAVFMKRDERADIAKVACELDAPFVGLWLSASPDTMIARVEARQGDASDADEEIVRRQIAHATGPVSWTAIDASRTPEATLEAARDIVDDAFALAS